MENFLESLDSLTEAWQSYGLASYNSDPKFTLLSGVGLFLLYACYLILKTFLLLLWKRRRTRKPQDGTEKKRGSRKTGQREAEEGQKLQSILQRPPGEPYDPTGFRQLLCPDPCCAVCNEASAQVSHLLCRASQEDRDASESHLASTASGTETSFVSSPLSANDPGHPISAPLPEPSPSSHSIPLPNLTTPLEGLISPIPDSLSPQASPPLSPDKPPQPPLSFPPLLQHATQETESDLPSEELIPQSAATLSMVDSPSELSSDVPIARGTDYAKHAMSESCQEQPDADSQSSNKLVPYASQQLLDTHASQAPFQEDTGAYFVKHRDLPSPSPDILALFETQEKMETDLVMSNLKKMETESFANPQNLEVSFPLGKRKNKPGDPHINQQLPNPKNSEEQLEAKDIQFFWGHHSLHSESLNLTTAASADGSSICAGFNGIGKGSSNCPVHPIPLSLPESELQAWPKIIPQSQAKDFSHARPKALPQNPIPGPIPSRPQFRICGVRFHKPLNEVQPLSSAEIHRLEFNILQKTQESIWGLPPVVQNAQEGFCFPPPKLLTFRHPFKLQMSLTILTGDFPLTEEVRKKLEHHLRKTLIQHFWGLPQRICQSISLMSPQTENSDPSESQSSRGLPWISLFRRQASQDFGSLRERSESLFHERSDSLAPKWRSDGLAPKWRSDSLSPKWRSDGLAPKWRSDSLSPKWRSDSLGPKWRSDSLAPKWRSDSLAPKWRSDSLAPKRRSESFALKQRSESLDRSESLNRERLESLTHRRSERLAPKSLNCEKLESLPHGRSERLAHERSESLHPEKGQIKIQTHSPETIQRDHPQSDPKVTPEKSLQSDSEVDPEYQLKISPGKCSPMSECHKEHKDFLQAHLDKKIKEISEGQIPDSVSKSQHTVSMALLPPEKFPSPTKDIEPLVGEDGPFKSQQSSILSRSREKILEDHIKIFNKWLTYGLPYNVEESLKSYIPKGEPHNPFQLLSSGISEVYSLYQTSNSTSRKNTLAYSRDKMETSNLIPTLEVPQPPPDSPVRQEEHLSQMHSASENKRVLVEDLSTVQNGTETIQQWIPSIVDNTSQKQPGSDNRDTPELATTPLQPNNESTNPQSPEGERMNWEDDPTHKDSTEMLKGNQLLDLQPRPAKISTTPGESSSGSTGTEHKSDGTLTTERAEKEISFPQDPETLYPTSQASREVMLKSERGKQAQVPDPPDTPLASKEMTSKFRGLSSGDTMASQVLCVHLPAGGISMEQQQGPRLPTNISRRSQNKAFPPATKTRGAQATEAGKLGGGNAGLETSQTRGRRRTVQDKTPEEIRRCTSSPAQTAKRQPSPDSHITNQIKSFWQWLSPGRKHKGQEKSLAKGGPPLPSAKGKSLIKR